MSEESGSSVVDNEGDSHAKNNTMLVGENAAVCWEKEMRTKT